MKKQSMPQQKRSKGVVFALPVSLVVSLLAEQFSKHECFEFGLYRTMKDPNKGHSAGDLVPWLHTL